MIVPPPPGEHTHQSTQTPQANTGSSANTQPQPPASKHAHNKPQQVRPQANTRNVPTPTRVGTPSVSAGTRVLAEATGTNEAQTTRRGHAGQRTQQARKQPGLRTVCACARKGGQRERRPLTIAHARARGLLCLWACLRTFVGVFGLVGLGCWVFFGGVWRVFWFFDIFGL